MITPSPNVEAVQVFLKSRDGLTGDLGQVGREFARTINRLQRLARVVLLSEQKDFRRTIQRWRLVDGVGEIELGTERRGGGRFALVARWVATDNDDTFDEPRP